MARRPDLKGKSLEAIRGIMRRETWMSLRSLRSSRSKPTRTPPPPPSRRAGRMGGRKEGPLRWDDAAAAQVRGRNADSFPQYASTRSPDLAVLLSILPWIGATQPERLPPLAATVGGRGGCQQPRRGTFLRASLTAYNPKGDTLRTERSMLQCGLAISITALTVLGMAITAVAAPYTPKSGQCYSACEAKCAAQHSCERSAASRDCFTHYNQCKAACRSSCSQ